VNIEIGAPVYNEESGIIQFLDALQNSVKHTKSRFPAVGFSLVLVDDGSRDNTIQLIRQYQYPEFTRVRLISFSRNFGHPAAISALIDQTAADSLLLMDADMQDSPDIVPELVQKWISGNHSVQVVRTSRSESMLFRLGHYVFAKIFTGLTGLRSDVGIFGIYDRTVINAVQTYPERLRFIPGIISSVGFKNDYVFAPRNQRLDGDSRVGFLKLIHLGLLAWFSYSSIPIHFITGIGLLLSLLSLVAGGLVIAVKITTDLAIAGWASLLSAQFFLGGLIIFSLGIVGQYIGIIFEEVKNRPIYIIAEEHELRRE